MAQNDKLLEEVSSGFTETIFNYHFQSYQLQHYYTTNILIKLNQKISVYFKFVQVKGYLGFDASNKPYILNVPA